MVRWKNARRSENVEDHRGGGGGRKVAVGGGIGGIIMALIAIFVFKEDPQKALQGIGNKTQQPTGASSTYKPTAQEQERADFVTTILAFTEDVWDEAYPIMARAPKYRGAPARYKRPTLNFFSGQISSACGHATAAVGPFYCPGDDEVYIDLSFFNDLERKFKAPGDFAQAYVVAHEVGHHIQNMLGLSRKVQSQRRRLPEAEYNRLQVRLELHADYLAGVWAHRAQKKFDILERGDIEEGLRAAGAVGDDTIQKRSRGYVVPDSFTHGTAEQRRRWFTFGLKSGDPLSHDPFEGRYEDL